jgi:hypothetical protein
MEKNSLVLVIRGYGKVMKIFRQDASSPVDLLIGSSPESRFLSKDPNDRRGVQPKHVILRVRNGIMTLVDCVERRMQTRLNNKRFKKGAVVLDGDVINLGWYVTIQVLINPSEEDLPKIELSDKVIAEKISKEPSKEEFLASIEKLQLIVRTQAQSYSKLSAEHKDYQALVGKAVLDALLLVQSGKIEKVLSFVASAVGDLMKVQEPKK